MEARQCMADNFSSQRRNRKKVTMKVLNSTPTLTNVIDATTGLEHQLAVTIDFIERHEFDTPLAYATLHTPRGNLRIKEWLSEDAGVETVARGGDSDICNYQLEEIDSLFNTTGFEHLPRADRLPLCAIYDALDVALKTRTLAAHIGDLEYALEEATEARERAGDVIGAFVDADDAPQALFSAYDAACALESRIASQLEGVKEALR